MPEELTQEEKDKLVQSLASEFGITEDTANACFIAASWDEEAARRVASLNRVQHLLINLRFTGKNPLLHGGIVSILLAHGEPEPEHLLGITIDGTEYIEDISPHFPPIDFIKAILYPPRRSRGHSTWLSLKQSLILNMDSESVEALFSIGGEKTSEVDENGTIQEYDPLKDAVSNLVKPVIDDLFLESIKLEISAEFLNGFQHDNLKLLLKEKDPEDEGLEETGTEKRQSRKPETFKVRLRGRLIIDPHKGVPVEDLEVGDTIICDIIDISSVAIEVAKMLGAYKRGIWFPIKGKIQSIDEGLSGTRRITLLAGRGIYILTTALSSVRVKVSESEMDSILRRIDIQREESVRSLLGMLPLAFIILGVALALTILLQRG